MMILKKIYTEPAKFFETVYFDEGVNFIYAYRDPAVPEDKEGTLNNLGKSSFLDLIDFCLCSSFDSTHSPRLYGAYQEEILKGITVFLEFEFDTSIFTISRSFDSPDYIQFFPPKQKPFLNKLKDARLLLFNLIFNRGMLENDEEVDRLRSILPFYINIIKHRKLEYPDPFHYLEHKNYLSLLILHLFILNIDNAPFIDLLHLTKRSKKCDEFMKENMNSVKNIYGLHKFDDAKPRLNQMNAELEDLKHKLVTFHLAQSQQLNAKKASGMSKKINDLTLQNFVDQQKIDTYKESIKNNLSIRLCDVEKLYNQTSQLFGTQIKKTLNEAVEFKTSLHASRKAFLQKEIETLQNNISERNNSIEKLDAERAKIYSILSTANSVKNYSDSRNLYDSKLKETSILEEQINSVNRYQIESSNIDVDIDKLTTQILSLKDSLTLKEKELVFLITDIYSAIYGNTILPQSFSFSTDINTDSILRMNILESRQKQGKGKNKTRTLIYNLAVLFYSIHHNYNSPRFIIHDGLFDGVDRAKALETFDFLEKKKKEGYNFQYIVTLNYEGILEDYGERGEKLHERILREAILKLTPEKPLFKKKF